MLARLMRRFFSIRRSPRCRSEARARQKAVVRRIRGTTRGTHNRCRAQALSQHGREESEESWIVHDHGLPGVENRRRVSLVLFPIFHKFNEIYNMDNYIYKEVWLKNMANRVSSFFFLSFFLFVEQVCNEIPLFP